MSNILAALGSAALLLSPVVVLMIVVSVVAGKRGEENAQGGNH
jgi:hypothetical protein